MATAATGAGEGVAVALTTAQANLDPSLTRLAAATDALRASNEAAERARKGPLSNIDQVLAHYNIAYLNSCWYKTLVLVIPIAAPLMNALARADIMIAAHDINSSQRPTKHQNCQDLLALRRQYQGLEVAHIFLILGALAALLATRVIDPASTTARVFYAASAVLTLAAIWDIVVLYRISNLMHAFKNAAADARVAITF